MTQLDDAILVDHTNKTERRSSPRRRGTAALEVVLGDGIAYKGRLLDLSESGARLQLDAPTSDLEPGMHLRTRAISIPRHLAEPQDCVIAWIGNDSSIGVYFAGTTGVSLEPIDVDRVKVDLVLATRLAPLRAQRWQVLPLAREGDRLLVAASTIPSPRTLAALQRGYGLTPEIHLADPERLSATIDRIYAGLEVVGQRGSVSIDIDASIDRGASIDIEAGAPSDDDAVGLCDRMLAAAVVQNASDIHIDSYDEEVRIRFRIDGQIEHFKLITPEQGAALISRVKVLAGLDISERRAAQDGRMRHEHGTAHIDIRVATLPAKQGERLTLRLLAHDTDHLTLPALGMSDEQLGYFNEAIRKPHGMVLITGPTGSGKSTTLYAAIRQLISESTLNVITIEDPVEYQIGGITQVEIDQREKVTFAKALRSTLRHDPDVIMVGEIRDAETADIAVKAALTGHLVFSTLHTNDATGAITRLRDMGVPLYLVGATLRLVMAQRLVRRICNRCSVITPCSLTGARALGKPELENHPIHEPNGCIYCGGHGYSGRLALFELLPNDVELSTLISSGAPEASYIEHMRSRELPFLADAATKRLLDGQTSLTEVIRNVVSVI